MSLNVLFVHTVRYRAEPRRDAQGTIVTRALQRLIDNTGGVVTINNNNFNDPAVSFTKHLAALVARNGVLHCFSCQEGRTIDFTSLAGRTKNNGLYVPV
jgi:hypothetical protein